MLDVKAPEAGLVPPPFPSHTHTLMKRPIKHVSTVGLNLVFNNKNVVCFNTLHVVFYKIFGKRQTYTQTESFIIQVVLLQPWLQILATCYENKLARILFF